MAYRYIGNKSRLIDHITEVVRSLVPPGGHVADPMCGTATVSGALASAGYAVTAADELTFPVLHARVRLLIDCEPPFEALGGYQRALETLNGLRPRRALFHREYSDAGEPTNGSRPRAYFTGANASKIDAIRARLRTWKTKGLLEDLESSVLYHDLIMAANKVANIAGTYGYYRSSWNQSALESLTMLPTQFEGGRNHEVLQGRVEDLIGDIESDLVYLDPPYTKRQYAGNYHILETLAVGDNPEPVGEGGLRDWYDQYSAFCSKRTVREAFATVFENLRAKCALLSYSEDGLIPADELKTLLGDFGEVERRDLPLGRFRSNGGRGGSVTEHLYLVRMA